MEKLMKYDENIFNFLKKHSFDILFILITLVSILARIKFIDYESEDYRDFLIGWFNTFKNGDGILELRQNIGNYNVPYLFIISLLSYLPIKPLISIKAVSILFDYILAFASMLIVYEILKNDKDKHLYALLTYLVVVILPTVLLNSSAWAQCDSIYTTFILFSILYIIKEKYFKAFIFLGISFSFKLQAIFLLPAFIIIYISKRKFPIFYFAIIPVVDFIMCLPAIIFGRGVWDCLTIYINQMGYHANYISMNIPNIYSLLFETVGNTNLILNFDNSFSNYGTWLTLSIFAIIAVIILYKKIELDNKGIITLCIWSILTCVFFLPHMHDRYLYIADVLSIIYFIIIRKNIFVPIAINSISFYTYIVYLYSTKIVSIPFVAILYIAVLYNLSKEIFSFHIKENNL